MCIRKHILSCLAYFDLFNYPLEEREIFKFLQAPASYDEFRSALKALVESGWVFRFEDLYTLQNDFGLVKRRRDGNLRAAKMLKRAEKIAAFLSCFPFVRGVAVSGSLSKNFADENSDTDFFIITKANRLWVARTILHFIKKISFLFGLQHWFCMNYFVDEESLQIKEKNLYTAIELVTVIPYRGRQSFQQLLEQNTWRSSFLPNFLVSSQHVKVVNGNLLKKAFEFLLSNSYIDRLDDYLMSLTSKRWDIKTEEGRVNSRGIVMGMDTSKHYAKPLPGNFQVKLMLLYEQKITQLLIAYDRQLIANSTAEAV